MAEIDLMKKCASASHRMRRNIVKQTYDTGKTGAHLGGKRQGNSQQRTCGNGLVSGYDGSRLGGHPSLWGLPGIAEAMARMGYLPPEKAVEKKGSMAFPFLGEYFILWERMNRKLRNL